MKKQSFLSSLFSSVFFKVIGYLAGFTKHIIIAAAIGLSGQLDIFYMAMAFIGILITTWSGALEFAAMPRLVKAESDGEKHLFGTIAGKVFLIGCGASLIITFLVIAFRSPLTEFAFGFDIDQRAVLADAFLWLIPVMLLSFPLAFFGAILRSKRHFSWFYLSDALLAIILLTCIAIAPDHPTVLLWSMSIGVAVACIFSAFLAAPHIRITVNTFGSENIELFKRVPGLMLLFGTSSIFIVLDRVFASFLKEGSISALAYALILIQVTIRIFGIKDSFLTVAAEKSGRKQRSEILNDLFSLVIFISAGAAAFFMTAGTDIITVLFERGAFGATDSATVSSALLAFAFLIAPGLIIQPLDQIYQIEDRIPTMVKRTLIGITAGIVLNYVAVFVLEWGIVGIAIATSISYWMIALLGVFGLYRLGYGITIKRHLKWAGWCVSSVVVGWCVFMFLPEMDHLPRGLAAAVIIGFVLLAAGYLYPPSREADLRMQVQGRLIGKRFQ